MEQPIRKPYTIFRKLAQYIPPETGINGMVYLIDFIKQYNKLKQKQEEAVETTVPKQKEAVETTVPKQKEAVETTVPKQKEVVETTVPKREEAVETTVPKREEAVESTVPKQEEAAAKSLAQNFELIGEYMPEILYKLWHEMDNLYKEKVKLQEENYKLQSYIGHLQTERYLKSKNYFTNAMEHEKVNGFIHPIPHFLSGTDVVEEEKANGFSHPTPHFLGAV